MNEAQFNATVTQARECLRPGGALLARTASGSPMNGEAFQQFTSGFYAAFPGLRHTIEDVVAEGERVSVRLTIKGVHQGDFQDLPPTGKAINISAINLFHLVNGKVVKQWVEYDGLGMLQQLGVIPPAG